MSQNLLTINNLCYNTVVLQKEILKAIENCSFRALTGQKHGQDEPYSK